MKKNNKEATRAMEQLTIGIDLGDKYSRYHMLDESGKLVESGSVLNTEASVRQHFADLPAAVIALEAGARTHWWAHLLGSFRHRIIAANAREFAAGKGRARTTPTMPNAWPATRDSTHKPCNR